MFKVLPQGCAVSQDFLGTTLSEVLDHEDLKDDNNKGVIRIIDDIAGVVISKDGVTPDPERMSGLAKYPRPTT